MKYGAILWTYVIQEARTASFQCVNMLKQELLSFHLNQPNSENVITFTMQFQQLCNDLGKSVLSEAPFLLNEQLSTSLVEQFYIKFMSQSSTVNAWFCYINGMSHDTI